MVGIRFCGGIRKYAAVLCGLLESTHSLVTHTKVPTVNAGVTHREKLAVKHSRLVIRDSITISGRAMKYSIELQKEEVVYHDTIAMFKGIVAYKWPQYGYYIMVNHFFLLHFDRIFRAGFWKQNNNNTSRCDKMQKPVQCTMGWRYWKGWIQNPPMLNVVSIWMNLLVTLLW